MPQTIGLVANIYNEVNALPGWLETHLPFFDDVRVTHSGPQGEYSNDGTIELLKKWRVPIDFDSIDEGYGAVRTRAIRRSPCDYVMLLDADERFYPTHWVLMCSGDDTPPGEVDRILGSYDTRHGKSVDWNVLGQLGSGLRVDIKDTYNQGARLREILELKPDAVCTVRRHWHDFSFRKPTQNWRIIPDWQARTVRNNPSIYFESGTRMHEKLVGTANVIHADFMRGPFFDHFHFTFKRMEERQRAHDVDIYDAIHKGRIPPKSSEHIWYMEKVVWND